MIRKFLKGAIACLLLTAVLASPASAATIGGATVKGSNVRLRTSPDTSSASNIIKQMNSGTFLLVEEKCGNWYKVVCDGVEGYVSADYASFASTLDGKYTFSAGTDGTSVNMRAMASTGGAIVQNYPTYNTALTVTGVAGDWLKVRDGAGNTGYIRSDYVRYTGAPAAQTASWSGSLGAQLAATAKNYLGYSYRWGGMSPATGFDCSGFVNYIYDLYGYDLDRTAQDIYSKNGVAVSKSALQPGDVLCFGWSSWSITHVGIYIGDGKMVHASTANTGVIISDINSAYYTGKYVGAKRILA